MKLILISNPFNFENEQALLRSIFEAGLAYFHLRKPELSATQMEDYLLSIPAKYHDRIMLHSHYSLCEKYNLRGVHHAKSVPACFKQGLKASTSVHAVREMEDSWNYNYVFLSPVFNSISKPGYMGNFNLNELKRSLQALKIQDKHPEVIALGGIDENNISITQDIGFNGVAVLGSIWETFLKNKNIHETLEKFNKIQEQCRLLVPMH